MRLLQGCLDLREYDQGKDEQHGENSHIERTTEPLRKQALRGLGQLLGYQQTNEEQNANHSERGSVGLHSDGRDSRCDSGYHGRRIPIKHQEYEHINRKTILLVFLCLILASQGAAFQVKRRCWNLQTPYSRRGVV